ncbi:hypothetical protein LAZ67_22001662 [Cordylochernes scorpioides]|uniref:Uncharacterized protein n=1 Tax=Cordylochernes scorpioides TaxID=51811 RepID=A0ABY6LRN7_9ARAC|nr:hypothetical protein LAZ67_22001662 [Cordylochernes scorpioides]
MSVYWLSRVSSIKFTVISFRVIIPIYMLRGTTSLSFVHKCILVISYVFNKVHCNIFQSYNPDIHAKRYNFLKFLSMSVYWLSRVSSIKFTIISFRVIIPIYMVKSTTSLSFVYECILVTSCVFNKGHCNIFQSYNPIYMVKGTTSLSFVYECILVTSCVFNKGHCNIFQSYNPDIHAKSVSSIMVTVIYFRVIIPIYMLKGTTWLSRMSSIKVTVISFRVII